MDKRQEKLFGEAYDKMYDLDSSFRYKFKDIMDRLEAEAKALGYEFKLSDKTQKWKCKRIKQ